MIYSTLLWSEWEYILNSLYLTVDTLISTGISDSCVSCQSIIICEELSYNLCILNHLCSSFCRSQGSNIIRSPNFVMPWFSWNSVASNEYFAWAQNMILSQIMEIKNGKLCFILSFYIFTCLSSLSTQILVKKRNLLSHFLSHSLWKLKIFLMSFVGESTIISISIKHFFFFFHLFCKLYFCIIEICFF